MVQAINELGDDRYSLFSKSFLPESLKTLEVHIARICNNSEKTALKLWQSLTTSPGLAHMESRASSLCSSAQCQRTSLKELGRAELSPVGHSKHRAKGLVLLWPGRALPSGRAEEQEGQ